MIEINANTKELNALLQKQKNKIKNPRPLMKLVEGLMLDSVEQNFSAQGRPSWLPLSPSTEAQRMRLGYTGPILQRTRQLKNSITSRSDAQNAIIGTNVRYAKTHQFGATIKKAPRSETFKRNRYVKGSKKGKFKKGTKPSKGFSFKGHQVNIPARPFFKLIKSDYRLIMNEVKRFFKIT